MPAVDNDFLLLYYNTRADHLKGLFGEEAPAQKMFLLVSGVCAEYQKLQHRTCSPAQRHQSTSVILEKLAEIIAYIDSQQIPDYAGKEAILWFDYDGEIYTLYDLSTSLIQQYVDYQDSIHSFADPSTSHPAPRQDITRNITTTKFQYGRISLTSTLERHIRTITFKRRTILTTREGSCERTQNQIVVSARNRGAESGNDES